MLEVVGALDAAGRLAGGLHCRQEQRDQDADRAQAVADEELERTRWNKPKQVVWAPLKDITPYELAQAQPVLIRMLAQRQYREGVMYMYGAMPDQFDKLPPDVRRHFKVEDA